MESSTKVVKIPRQFYIKGSKDMVFSTIVKIFVNNRLEEILYPEEQILHYEVNTPLNKRTTNTNAVFILPLYSQWLETYYIKLRYLNNEGKMEVIKNNTDFRLEISSKNIVSYIEWVQFELLDDGNIIIS